MASRTLVTTRTMAAHLADPLWLVVDCRFSLDDKARGERDYRVAHVPGAVYANVERELSSPAVAGKTGRHPLPDIDYLADLLGSWGVDDGVTVVAYDDAGGSMASRLWWLLRYLGHDDVAVLNGGWATWLARGCPVSQEPALRESRRFVARPRPWMVVGAPEVERLAHGPRFCLLDARSAERYRGEGETIDPVAGHIPDARSAPWLENLRPNGTLKAAARLRSRYEELLGDAPASRAIVYCGSGITATHDVLAMCRAGFDEPRLFAGSWSEWITEPSRPVAVGPEPGRPATG